MRQTGFRGKIVGVTGNGLKEQIEYFTKAGCDHVLVKPFSLEDFNGFMRGSAGKNSAEKRRISVAGSLAEAVGAFPLTGRRNTQR